MNYRGSYRNLLKNSQAAMLAAIEIYNKPNFAYRDECFVILLLNAWELALKALLSKNKKSIYYAKKRGEAYRTFSLRDAILRTEAMLPASLPALAAARNLALLNDYRDSAVHFYNKPGFGGLIYSLAQKAILNYVELLKSAFGVHFAKSVTWQLLPVGLDLPIDPIDYIEGVSKAKKRESLAVREFVAQVQRAASDIQSGGGDPTELMVTVNVSLQSVKKLSQADVVVGVAGEGGTLVPTTIVKPQDPNITHPLLRLEILQRVGGFGVNYSDAYVLQAMMWKHKILGDKRFCWVSEKTGARQFSHDFVQFLKKQTKTEIAVAVKEYGESNRAKQKARRRERA